VAWKSQVMSVKALDLTGNGYSSNLAAAIQWAADHGADIISMSWGYQGPPDPTIDAP